MTYGRTLSQAYLNLETVEHSARIMFVARLLGSPKALDVDQVCDLIDLKKKQRIFDYKVGAPLSQSTSKSRRVRDGRN